MSTNPVLRSVLVLVIAAIAVSPAAQADVPAATITPPKLTTYVAADYPPEALAAGRGASVELIITVGADGAVTDVEVAHPVGEGFDEAAVAAARRFVFEPARKDGAPTAARIRYVYVFTPPPPPAAPAVTTGKLEGRVLDRGDDTPVIGADVAVENDAGATVSRTSTDADGAFSVDALPAGHYRVRIVAFEHRSAAVLEDVTAGDATTVTYRLDAEHADRDDTSYGATAVVEAPEHEVTTRKLRGDELTNIAGAHGDALRAVELLPGVARPPSGAGFLIVRGSAPWDSAVLLDGAEVPLLYHFGGLTSFVPSGLLQSIDLYPGNFSVRFGRRIGGVIDVALRDPRTDRVHATADASLTDSAFNVEGPLGHQLSFFAGARRSYMDVWFKHAIPADQIGVDQAPVYWDWQTMLAWKPTSDDRVRLTGYGSSDTMDLLVKEPSDQSPTMRGRVAQDTGFHRAAIEWHHRYTASIEHDASLAFGPFRFDAQMGPSAAQTVHGLGLYGRTEWRARATSWLTITGGLDINDEWGHLTYVGPKLAQLEGNPGFMDFDHEAKTEAHGHLVYFRPAAYVEASVRPVRDVQLIGGLRSDYFGDTGQVTLDPRVVARWTVAPAVVVKAGLGHFSQPPTYGDSIPGLGNPQIHAISARHTDVGVEWTPIERASLGLDGFYKHLDHLITGGPGMLENAGTGRIYGLELSARLAPGERFSGFLSYTLSRSERNDHGDHWRLFDFDQTHILSAAGMYQLSRTVSLGATLRIASGNPTTPITGSVYDANLDVYEPVYGAVNSERTPLFHELDVRVDKQWTVGRTHLDAYLDVQNVYDARHVEGEVWNYDYTQKVDRYGLPILPRIGLRGEL